MNLQELINKIIKDNNFKDYSSAAPGVITGGNVSVGTGSYLGLGCIIKNNIMISNNIIIGTGSLINKNCKMKKFIPNLTIK